MDRAGLRIGVVGATGAVGAGLLEALAASSIRVAQIVAVASERSVGVEVDFESDSYPVVSELPNLRGVDCIFLCAPPEISREAARAALRAEVPVIDLSGAMASTAEVPLRVADISDSAADDAAPLIATPAGAAIALATALAPVARRAGLARVRATVLGSAGSAGMRGTDALLRESLALFSQQDPPEPEIFARPVAFDCGPGAEADAECEERIVGDLKRLLGADIGIHVTAVQVPTFLGLGCIVDIETREPLSATEAAELLGKATGVDVWSEGAAGPTLRAASGRDSVLVGRLRDDPTAANALGLWFSCDPVSLAAANAVKLAEARLRGR